jgi:hypothetical protein
VSAPLAAAAASGENVPDTNNHTIINTNTESGAEVETAPTPLLTEPGELGKEDVPGNGSYSLNEVPRDLVDVALERQNPDPTSKVKCELALPATASPKQQRSSLILFNLAAKLEDSKTNDLPPEGTPKPAYLRRLDSPDSHHGQLIMSKAKLQLIINTAIQKAGQVRLSSLPIVKQKFEVALSKLESSLVGTT